MENDLTLLKNSELIEIINDNVNKLENIDKLKRNAEKQGRTTIDISKIITEW